MSTTSQTVTISGQIARRNSPIFWGRITINKESGLIAKVEKVQGLRADYQFGPACFIFAGFGDVHIHAREDQTGKQNYKETYKTAADAALHGGVVHVCAMPNTPSPVVGEGELVWHRGWVHELGHPVSVLNYIGIDKKTRPIGRKGQYPYKLYFGKSVGSLTVTYASELDEILARYRDEHVSFHVEYEPIVQASAAGRTHSDRRPVACVNEGLRLLLPLIEKHGVKAKLCHWSTGGESFKLIREYRRRGCDIVLEASPLHLFFDTTMTDRNPLLWTKIQMNPAVQGPEHRMALIKGLKEGFIQFLATDHAPHTEEEKFAAFAEFSQRYPGKTNKEIAAAIRADDFVLFDETCVKNNMSGAPWLDTYAIVCSWLIREHEFTTQDIARVAAHEPGKFVSRFLQSQFPGRDFGKGFGDIAKGYVGSLTVLNTKKPTTVHRNDLMTKVKWSPLEGLTLPGSVEAIFIEGKRY